MGFVSAFSNFGSIGSTTKWAINGYENLKSKNKSDIEIFEEMIIIRYSTISNDSHKNHLLQNIEKLPGLAGLTMEVLNVEADLALNSADYIEDMVKPIFTRLEKTNLSEKTKYGKLGQPFNILTGEPIDIDAETWMMGPKWLEFIYTFQSRKI